MAGTTKKGSAVHGQYKKEEYGRVHAYVDGTADWILFRRKYRSVLLRRSVQRRSRTENGHCR